jgi:FeS assembly protein IscX
LTAQIFIRAGGLTVQFKAVTCSEMKLTWKDYEEIAWALMDKFPDQDPLKLSFPKLHQLVTELDEFDDDPNSSNEKILENIQMTWYEETK